MKALDLRDENRSQNLGMLDRSTKSWIDLPKAK